MGWVLNFSHKGKKFDQHGKCSERSDMDLISTLASKNNWEKAVRLTALGGRRGSVKEDNVTFFTKIKQSIGRVHLKV